jgi:plasmid stabilization system protein ParE
MRLVIHPEVFSDISAVMEYYERVATSELAEEFYSELRLFIQRTAEKPEVYAIRERDLRRVNMRRFPYHILFRIAGNSVRILAVRHHSRDPSAGMDRR